jgi:hypothetical protein
MQAFHEPPSRRPHCSSTQQWVTPELGLSSTPGQGIQTQAEVTGNSVTHNTRKNALQESPTLTAHRPSFPTCLFHPRRVHLLCHLDSPSAASLPYLGLQEQTGPEVSGFCGSYRVPSKSSLLPLRTLSPGGSRSQANKPHAVQNCVPQQTQGKWTQASQEPVQQSQDALTVKISEQGFMHKLAQLFLGKQETLLRN